MIANRLLRSRSRATPFLIESLEPRTLLSGDTSLLISMAGWDHSEHPPAVNAPLNLQNLVASPVDISAVSGVKFRGDVATLTSDMRIPPGQFRKLRASIDWGDGTTSSGWFTIGRNKVIHVKGAHAYASTGDFTVTVTISAKHSKHAGTPLVVTDSATVTQNSATGLTINPVAGTAFTSSVGSFSLPAGDTNTDPASFLAYIKWGDGSHSLGTITLNPDGTYDVAGTHTYAAAGTFRITVLVFQQPPASSTSAVTPKSSDWTCDSADLTRPTFIARIFSTALVTSPPPATP